MLDSHNKYHLEDVIDITGISERNVKFWVAEYRLKVTKEGRKNIYPEQTITLLRLIKELSESRFFTTKFIQIQVERCKNPSKTKIRGLSELNEITNRMLQYILDIQAKAVETFEPTEQKQAEVVQEPERLKSGPEQMQIIPELSPDNPKRIVIDDLSGSVYESEFKPVPTDTDNTVHHVLKDLKSPIITLAEEPREKKHTFWQQLKKVLK